LFSGDIEGRRGATGAFIITARLGPSVPGAVELDAGDVLTGAVSEASPGVVYDLNSAVDGNLYLMVRGHTPNASPDVALWATIPDQLAGNGSGLLDGVAFIITRGDAPYSLRVTYGGSGGEEHYTICLMRLADAAGCLGDFRASGPT
jgi:hypothetical protein